MAKQFNGPAWLYFVKEYPRQTMTMVFFFCLAGLAESVGAISVLPLLSTLFGGQSEPSPVIEKVSHTFLKIGIEPSLQNLLLVISVSIVLKALLSLVAYQRTGFVVADVVERLRFNLIDGLIKVRWPYFVSQETGKLTLALSTESSQAGMALRCFAQYLSCLIQAVTYLAAGAYLSWEILLAGLFVGGFFAFAFKGFISVVRKAGKNRSSSLNAMTAIFTDAIMGTKPLKVMGVGQEFMKYVRGHAVDCKKADKKYVMGVGLLTSIQEPILTILLCFGLYLATSSLEVSPAMLLSMAFFFHRIVSRFSSAQQYWQIYSGQTGVLLSLLAKLGEIESNLEQLAGDKQIKLSRSVSLEKVNFSYGDKSILQDFTLKVPFGEITALYGPSGTGKTTVADMVAGLVMPENRSVLVDGVPMKDIDIAHWRRQIGYVPQEVFLFHDTVRNNIALGRNLSDADIQDALDKAGALNFVGKLANGLDTVVGEHGRMLSGGQRQRLMIARAIVIRPRLLILDESTTGLDRETERGIMESIVNMKKEMAILAVSHQEAVKKVADHIVEFKQGGGRG
jgi:ATP-binding cassette subfamily C protein